MKCLGSCHFLSGLWIDLSVAVADIHLGIDAKNLVTRARTTQLPERKGNDPHDFHVEKGSLFRKYSSSCSHINSELFGRFFFLTKSSAKADTLITAVKTEIIGKLTSKLQDTHGAQSLLVA